MTYSPYQRRNYSGNAAQTELSAGISGGDSTLTVADGSNYPAADFWIVIDRGLSTEEKVFVTTRSINTFSGLTRGGDSTAAAAHSSGATVHHCYTAVDADEANALAAVMTTKGDLITRTTAAGPTRLPVGSNGLPLTADSTTSTGHAYQALGPTGLASDSVTTAKILDANVTTAKIADLNVTTGKLADSAVTSAKIANGTIVAADIADATITAAKAVETERAGWIPSFASTGARDAAIPSPVYGMECVVTGGSLRRYFYNGTRWIVDRGVSQYALGHFVGYRAAAFTHPGNATWTAVSAIDTETSDPDNAYPGGVWTAPLAGVYLVQFSVGAQLNNNPQVFCSGVMASGGTSPLITGSYSVVRGGSTGDTMVSNGGGLLHLASGATLVLAAYNNGSNLIQGDPGADRTFLHITPISQS